MCIRGGLQRNSSNSSHSQQRYQVDCGRDKDEQHENEGRETLLAFTLSIIILGKSSIHIKRTHVVLPKYAQFPHLLLLRRPHDEEKARQYAGDFF